MTDSNQIVEATYKRLQHAGHACGEEESFYDPDVQQLWLRWHCRAIRVIQAPVPPDSPKLNRNFEPLAVK